MAKPSDRSRCLPGGAYQGGAVVGLAALLLLANCTRSGFGPAATADSTDGGDTDPTVGGDPSVTDPGAPNLPAVPPLYPLSGA